MSKRLHHCSTGFKFQAVTWPKLSDSELIFGSVLNNTTMMKRLAATVIGLICTTAFAFMNSARGQNKAFQFTGAFYVNIPASSGSSVLNFTSDTFTIEAWVRPYSFPATTNNYEYTILGNDNAAPVGGGYMLRTGGSRKLSFYYSYGSGWQEVATAGPVLVTNQWHHIAVSKEAGAVKLYVDGQVVASATLGSNTSIASSTNTLKIGESGGLTNRKFYGGIDELKIWHTARTQLQVQSDGTEICGSYPASLLAYYKLDDNGTATLNPVACANNSSLDGLSNGFIQVITGALLIPAGTTELYVDSSHTLTTTCGAQAGYSWATAYSDLNPALAAAQLNPQIERIFVAQGTYYPLLVPFTMLSNGTSQMMTTSQISDRTLPLRPGLEVFGGYPSGGRAANPGSYQTVLDGSRPGGLTGYNSYSVVCMDSSVYWARANDTTKLVGFTITNGSAQQGLGILGNGYGGGIRCNAGTCLIQNCVITNNNCSLGGGGIYTSGNTIIIGDTLTWNYGGITGDGNTTIMNCFVFRNHNWGIYSYHGRSNTIKNNVIAENEYSGIGQVETRSSISGNWIHHNRQHGIYIYQSDTCHIENNTVTDHQVSVSAIGFDAGGGMYLYGGKQTVFGNVILRNAAGLGGGIYMQNGYNNLKHNRIEYNGATSYGGGIWCKWGNNWFINNIFAHDSAGNAAAMYVEGDGVAISNIIAGNTAASFVGGLYITGNYSVVNNVFARNKSTSGAALYCGGVSRWGNEVANNTFYANEVVGAPNSGNSAGALVAHDHNEVFNNIFWRNKYKGSDTIQGADYMTGLISGSTFRNNAMQLPSSFLHYRYRELRLRNQCGEQRICGRSALRRHQ